MLFNGFLVFFLNMRSIWKRELSKRKMMNISTTYLEDSSSREITTEAEDRKMPAINISSQTPPPPPLPTTPLLIDLNVGNCNDDAICID
mmetsp:Transcript_47031/g.71103  ORF Transcript_47031/g.71103 Transcript_47031/m.71103 type:complete len:89 (-) Transcript_47031:234-500(-)